MEPKWKRGKPNLLLNYIFVRGEKTKYSQINVVGLTEKFILSLL
jgi:hypothetical protein